MKDEKRTKEQLLNELAQLRKKVAQLEKAEAGRQKAEERINHLNRVLRAIRNVNQFITKEMDRDHLLKGICERLIATRGYHNAWIALFDENGELIMTDEAGLGDEFLPMAELLKRDGLGDCGQRVMKRSGVEVAEDPATTCTPCPLAHKYSGRSEMRVRLAYGDKLYGLLTVSIPSEMAMDREEQSLFQEMADDIASALHRIELEEEKRRTLDAMRESKARYRRLVETMSDGLDVFDERGHFTYVNRRFCEIVGFEQDELLGRHYSELLDEENRQSMARQLEKRRSGVEEPYEIEWTKKHGSKAITLMSLRVIVNEEGKDKGSFALVKDITDRKRAEEEQVRLTTAIEQAAESVVITDIDANIQYVNPAFEQITGYSREDVIGQNPRILQSGRHDQAFYKELWDTITEGRVWKGHFINKRKDGTLYEEEASISPVLDNTQRITHYVAVKRDVTEQIKLKEQLQQAQKMEAVGRLAGGIAHDFNNLLTTILGHADLMLLSMEKGHPLYGNTEEIKKAANRAASLTRQLLACSRKQILEPKVLTLNDVVGEMDKMLRRLIGEDIDLVTVLEPDLWHVKVDLGQMDQVIMNIAVNAKDAMPRGGKLTIEMANVELDEAYARSHDVALKPGPYVMLAISDTGTGMDESIRSRIFDPFFTTKEAGKGTGLGLSTVYGIIKQSGGYIWVYSEPGEGTTFKIYLPKAEQETEPIQKDEVLGESLKGSETVLLAEDSDMVLKLARDILVEYGYRVLEARNGEEAVRLSRPHEGPIHLLLTDVVMPGMSGRELAEQLQSLRPEIRVLYMSGYTNNAIVHYGILDQETAFIQKPFSPKNLAQKVREVLDRGIEVR